MKHVMYICLTRQKWEQQNLKFEYPCCYVRLCWCGMCSEERGELQHDAHVLYHLCHIDTHYCNASCKTSIFVGTSSNTNMTNEVKFVRSVTTFLFIGEM
jgi:hypothetical protein